MIQIRVGQLQEPDPKKCSIIVMIRNVKTWSKVIIIDSDVLTHALVKYYSFSGYFIRPFVHTPVRPYEGLFHSIKTILEYHNMCTSVGIPPFIIQNGRVY